MNKTEQQTFASLCEKWATNKNQNKATTMKKKIGIKAYGHEHLFKNKREFRAYLMDWIAGTDGAERDRAVDALTNLECGVTYTDTDAPDEPLTPEEFKKLCKLYAPKH